LLLPVAERLTLFCPVLTPGTFAICDLVVTRPVVIPGLLAVGKSRPAFGCRDNLCIVEDEGAGPAASAIRLALVRLTGSATLG